jgi:hypothetical protein
MNSVKFGTGLQEKNTSVKKSDFLCVGNYRYGDVFLCYVIDYLGILYNIDTRLM